jgi:hypothetical protein
VKSVAVSFDLDLTDYVGGANLGDELEMFWPQFEACCERIPAFRSTWFLRIDRQMQAIYGSADYIFTAHREKIAWLRSHGHEIGWHFHSYVMQNEKWVQNTDENSVASEMQSMRELVEKHKLKMLRMGWAYHRNSTVAAAIDMGIQLDCSPFPRPQYSWDNAWRNWEGTTQKIYTPAAADYRLPGALALRMLPMSTVPVAADTDTEAGVIRYINPAYKHAAFVEAVKAYQGSTLNTVSHPYEFLPNKLAHSLMAFDSGIFEKNMLWLEAHGYRFTTLSEMANNEEKIETLHP